MVLGSGPIRIGQGIEFDYSCVHCVRTLRKLGYDVVIGQQQPRNRLDRLRHRRPPVFRAALPGGRDERHPRRSTPSGVVVAFGGQTAIKPHTCLDRRRDQDSRHLGRESIDTAEDSERTSTRFSNASHITPPEGRGRHHAWTRRSAPPNGSDYPVLLRPSYVIGGQNMVDRPRRARDVRRYMELILSAQHRKSRADR